MRERAPSPPPSEPERRSWDAAVIAGELDVPAEPRLDPLHGQGARMRFGEPPTLDLELFPAARLVRLIGPNLALTLAQEAAPRLASEGVIFDAPARMLSVAPTGETTLRINHPNPVETPPAPVGAAEGSLTHDAAEDGLQADLAAPENPSRQLSPTPKETEPQKLRVRLAGRLGTDVRYRTTRNGTLIASFPLAVTEDDGTVHWQTVTLFGDRATKLREGESPKRGQYTEVVGYLHQKEVTGKDGATRLVEEVYGVVVKPR